MNIAFLRKIIREVVTTDFSNDGQGGIESQTGSDLMGYWHGEGGPIHQGTQPAEDGSKHIYFNSGGGKSQSQDQTDSASESGAKEQVAVGMEESEDVVGKYSLIDYVLEYQKAAKDMKSSNFILEKIHKMSEGANGGKVSFKMKSGKYESKPVELLVNFISNVSGDEDLVQYQNMMRSVEISMFLNGDFVEKIENAGYFLLRIRH
jgi:hypothetical protein